MDDETSTDSNGIRQNIKLTLIIALKFETFISLSLVKLFVDMNAEKISSINTSVCSSMKFVANVRPWIF